MKKISTLFYLLCVGLLSIAQTIDPAEDKKICPVVDYANATIATFNVVRFEITFSVAANNYIIATDGDKPVGCKVISFKELSLGSLKAECYVAFEDQRSSTPSFTVKSASSSKTFKFPFIRSLKGLKPELQYLSPLNLPLCTTGNIPYSFSTQVKYKRTDNQDEFDGYIPLYEYSVPEGWKVGAETSTGQNNYILAVPGATIAYDELHTGEIKIRASQRQYICSGTSIPAAGDWVSIPFTRPELKLTVNGSTTLALTCGTSSAYTFTVENGNVAPCATYEWNLGKANNNWLYNGSPAPQYINTTSNAITLSAATCNGAPSDVSVAVKANNAASKTFKIPVTMQNPQLSITGAGELCNSQNYTIDNLPCNGTVQWASSDVSIATVTGNGNQATVTEVSRGVITLTATVSSSCGNVVLPITIKVGQPSTITGLKFEDLTVDCYTPINRYTAIGGIGATNYKWYMRLLPSGTFTLLEDGPNNFVAVGGGKPGRCVDIEMKVEASNTCNVNSPIVYTMPSDICKCSKDETSAGLNVLSISPNPSNYSIQIKLDRDKKNVALQKGIQVIRIIDKMGLVRKEIRGNGKSENVIQISDLPVDTYTILVFDGQRWIASKFVKN